MKLLIFSILIISNSLFADSLLTYNKSNDTYSYCVKDYYLNSHNILYFKKSQNNTFSNINLGRNYKSYSIVDGFEYKNGTCQLKNDLKISGLTSDQYNFMMILLANFCGLSIILPFSSILTRS